MHCQRVHGHFLRIQQNDICSCLKYSKLDCNNTGKTIGFIDLQMTGFVLSDDEGGKIVGVTLHVSHVRIWLGHPGAFGKHCRGAIFQILWNAKPLPNLSHRFPATRIWASGFVSLHSLHQVLITEAKVRSIWLPTIKFHSHRTLRMQTNAQTQNKHTHTQNTEIRVYNLTGTTKLTET